ncbi:MAG: hypothetical protein WD737_14735 [Gemmatimonadota bacterium]
MNRTTVDLIGDIIDPKPGSTTTCTLRPSYRLGAGTSELIGEIIAPSWARAPRLVAVSAVQAVESLRDPIAAAQGPV